MYKSKLLALAFTLAIIAVFYCNDLGSVEASNAIAYSPDGEQLVVGCYDGSVMIYDTATRKGPPIK